MSGYTSSGAGWWDEEDFVRLRAQEGGTPQNIVTALSARDAKGYKEGDGLAYTLGQNERNRSQGPANYVTHALTSEGHDASEDGTGRGTPLVTDYFICEGCRTGTRHCHLFDKRCQCPICAYYQTAGPLGGGNDAIGRRSEDDPNLVAFALRRDPGGTGQGHNTTYVDGVRRLTPVECCRLQGFPDDWLGGNEPPDSPKYAALGDAVTVPVAEWIGRRMLEVMETVPDGSQASELHKRGRGAQGDSRLSGPLRGKRENRRTGNLGGDREGKESVPAEGAPITLPAQ